MATCGDAILGGIEFKEAATTGGDGVDSGGDGVADSGGDFSLSWLPPRTVELEDVDVVDSRTECRPLVTSVLALMSPNSLRICPILPDRFRVTGGLLGLCVLARKPDEGSAGEGVDMDDGVDDKLKLLGES